MGDPRRESGAKLPAGWMDDIVLDCCHQLSQFPLC
jgi:hypothetical protein